MVGNVFYEYLSTVGDFVSACLMLTLTFEPRAHVPNWWPWPLNCSLLLQHLQANVCGSLCFNSGHTSSAFQTNLTCTNNWLKTSSTTLCACTFLGTKYSFAAYTLNLMFKKYFTCSYCILWTFYNNFEFCFLLIII